MILGFGKTCGGVVDMVLMQAGMDWMLLVAVQWLMSGEKWS